ncbi:MAG: helicase-related protein, partial [Myxococcota bacterium]|nr:helicase-related protein [Myxococcota bacterium]
LRLLTLQQFQRAAALVCACEVIRRSALAAGDARWGREPFRIGLWVGQKTTPNKTRQSQESLRQGRGVRDGPFRALGHGSPAQLTSCPWCGAEIRPGAHIQVQSYEAGAGRTLIHCGDPLGRCPFSAAQAPGEGLPVLVVDEEIYRRLPTLLIATVDKFAQLPWNGITQMLFGEVDAFCPRHGFRSPDLPDADSHPRRGDLPAVRSVPFPPLRPPDLVIQDELHLISGPLGSLTGLYETAVDELCSWTVAGRRVRPKVIASTATIRRASQQVHALFLRRVAVFPPHGLEVGDNFFSLRRDPAVVPGRRYLGICAPGRRLKAVMIRVYVAFLAAGQQLYQRHGPAADPWMTLVGYFNAMRELAGMRRVTEDDVRTRLRDADRRGLARRTGLRLEELTSRKSSTDIPRLLDRLEKGFDPAEDAQREEARKERRRWEGMLPLDVLLATNMVSVGVDVKRLGLMVVCGQPKTTAEYIQATSRVGRSFPGLVATVCNWARPRDLSHYERFENYHARFYEHVEALSLTPFASRAMDRGLSALLVSLVRLPEGTFNANDRAEVIDPGHPLVARAIERIVERAAAVTASQEVADEVRTMLRARLDSWVHEARREAGT